MKKHATRVNRIIDPRSSSATKARPLQPSVRRRLPGRNKVEHNPRRFSKQEDKILFSEEDAAVSSSSGSSSTSSSNSSSSSSSLCGVLNPKSDQMQHPIYFDFRGLIGRTFFLGFSKTRGEAALGSEP